MGRVLKEGKIVIVLRGRFAGKKGVIVRVHEEGSDDRRYPHAVVAGIEQYPRKITRAMESNRSDATKKSKISKKSRVKPFVKHINLNHLMPTRYNLDLVAQLKGTLDDATLLDSEKLVRAKRQVKKSMEERYQHLDSGKSEKAQAGAQFFFRRLRF